MLRSALSGFRVPTAFLFALSCIVLAGCEATGPDVSYYFYKEYLEKPHYKVYITTGSGTYGAAVSCSRFGFPSAQAAVEQGMTGCEEFRKENYPVLTGGVYLYAIGDIKVWDMSDEQLKKAIEVYENNPDATNADLSSVKK